MDEKERQIREKLGIPLGAPMTVIELPKHVEERKTGGWTDDQIKGKTFEELDAMVNQAETAAKGLKEALTQQENRVSDLKMIRRRKEEIS